MKIVVVSIDLTGPATAFAIKTGQQFYVDATKPLGYCSDPDVLKKLIASK